MATNYFGRTLLKASEFVLFALFLLACATCKRQDFVKNQNVGQNLDYPLDNLSEFWSTPLIPGNDLRAIGFYENGGLYVLWEQLDSLPATQLHSAYGRYFQVNDVINLSNPFCGKYSLKIQVVDGVEVLLPQGMGVFEAKKANWFLIHREGANSERPFSFKNLSKFDHEN